jgi:hypothetical protein
MKECVENGVVQWFAARLQSLVINSSLNETIPNLKVFGLCKTRIIYWCFANASLGAWAQ